MKSVRLLPVVIFAALALLLFKGIGLVTNGGYILTGPTIVQAAGGTTAATAEAAPHEDAVLTDTSPELEDTAPTLATKAEAADSHGGASEESHSDAAPADASSETTETPAEAPEVACAAAPTAPTPDDGHGGGAAAAADCATAAVAVNEHGDALPLERDGAGNVVPVESTAGDNSEAALIGRLGERRSELDKREAEIGMRTALLEAAEKRLDQRTQELAALEARVAALVDEKQAAEEEGFKAVVSMYEGMKPKDAAKIFDTLSMSVLLKVARAMSPRKMSPILAAMSPDPAQKLTTVMAATDNTDVVVATGENLARLPQIVGQ